MSPEQAIGSLDARSDIFSLGAVLCEMVTGQRAFQGDSLIEALAAIVNQEPRPMPARIPSELARVISRCLRKEPARRYRTMADLTVALEDLREESLSPLQPPQRRRWAWGAVAVLVVAGASPGGRGARRRTRAPSSCPSHDASRA